VHLGCACDTIDSFSTGIAPVARCYSSHHVPRPASLNCPLPMAITELPFDNEAELERWAFSNLSNFIADCILLKKFQIVTLGGKGAVPDGLAFNIASGEWYVVECELIKHGVWPHIAEQITRFAVALQIPDTLRKIRDQLFEFVITNGSTNSISTLFNTSPDRLMQKIELFVEGVQPNILIFIDDTNQDLSDFAHALQMPTEIYRVRKFQVNGQLEYYSPDQAAPVLRTEPEEQRIADRQDYDVIEQLGGGSLLAGVGGAKFRVFQLNDGRIVNIKRSKFHAQDNYYWYGMSPNSLERSMDVGVTHYVFIMGAWEFVAVPIETVQNFCAHTKASKNSDGSIRHFHLLISPEPTPTLYWSNEMPKFDLKEYAEAFA
jgi:hypothetical protein